MSSLRTDLGFAEMTLVVRIAAQAPKIKWRRNVGRKKRTSEEAVATMARETQRNHDSGSASANAEAANRTKEGDENLTRNPAPYLREIISSKFRRLDEVVEKIERKHGVATEEVEEVFLGGREFRRGPKGRRKGEDLYYALRQTGAGRYLFIVFILKRQGKALVLTARAMTEREK